jgi:putative transposase
MFENWPFHITHRGNRRKRVFRTGEDRRVYLDLLDRFAKQFGMLIWAYCLMKNHVHLIAVGKQRSSIPKAMGITHQAYSRIRNRETAVTGHMWANRYFSTALDETHLWAAVRYVELNPMRSAIVDDAIDYAWSSASAHAGLRPSRLLDPASPFPGHIGDWAAWLRAGLEEKTVERLRANTLAGHPTGSGSFIRELEIRLGRRLLPGSVDR